MKHKGKATPWPYQNVSLKNLPRERWKDIPAFEGYYRISNYGRVKSMSREMLMNSPNGGVYLSKDKIRRARLDMKVNKTVNDKVYTLVITLNRDGIKYHYSVGRLVYYTFVEPFDLEDRTIYVSYKDGNGRNVHVSNLLKIKISAIKLRSYELGRAISHLRALSKPVTQFDAAGNVVASYDSMYEAGKKKPYRGTSDCASRWRKNAYV